MSIGHFFFIEARTDSFESGKIVGIATFVSVRSH